MLARNSWVNIREAMRNGSFVKLAGFRLYLGYAPYLACHAHGGPKEESR